MLFGPHCIRNLSPSYGYKKHSSSCFTVSMGPMGQLPCKSKYNHTLLSRYRFTVCLHDCVAMIVINTDSYPVINDVFSFFYTVNSIIISLPLVKL